MKTPTAVITTETHKNTKSPWRPRRQRDKRLNLSPRRKSLRRSSQTLRVNFHSSSSSSSCSDSSPTPRSAAVNNKRLSSAWRSYQQISNYQPTAGRDNRLRLWLRRPPHPPQRFTVNRLNLQHKTLQQPLPATNSLSTQVRLHSDAFEQHMVQKNQPLR